jgi:leucine dehydrogenase
MGRFVDSLDGRYITAEDVGTTTDDMVTIAGVTRWVTGLPREKGGSGNPAPSTALGTYLGLKATVEERFGASSLKGMTVAVQGLGQVGMRLAEMLHADGAKLVAADITRERVDDALMRFNATVCTDAEIFGVKCDVFAPCALGAILNDETIPRLRCGAVAGCSNNQLHESRHGDDLKRRGILYAPDFVINAGGIINVSLELEPGGYDPEKSARKIQNIPRALKSIYEIAKHEDVGTHVAADRLAEMRLKASPAGAGARAKA